jgi:hypothetical protein
LTAPSPCPAPWTFLPSRREMGCPLRFSPSWSISKLCLLCAKGLSWALLERSEERAAQDSLPNKGAEACLEALNRQKGLQLGILTRNSLPIRTQSTRTSSRPFMDLRSFAAIITRDDCPPKPHPEGVRRAARQHGTCSLVNFWWWVISGLTSLPDMRQGRGRCY